MTVKIIAEASGNHGGSLETFLKLADLAKNAGADYFKAQCFKPEAMTTAQMEAPGLWEGRKLIDVYREAMTPWDWFPVLDDYCRAIKLPWFASVFCQESLEYIARFNPPYLKIASFENNHFPLIKAAVKADIPLMISTGGMRASDFDDLRHWVTSDFGNSSWSDYGTWDDIYFLACTSAYPAKAIDANLGLIPRICQGYSDHCRDEYAACLAVAKGARFIERHISLSRDTVDGEFSSIGNDFITYVGALRLVEKMTENMWDRPKEELRSLRRACYAVRDISKNETFTMKNIAVLRGPGGGLHPKHLALMLDRKAKRDIKAGDPITDECL